MNKKLKVGIVGMGRAGQVHLRSLMRIQRELGLVDIQQVASNIASEAEILSSYNLSRNIFCNDYQQVLDNKELDIVVSAGATDTHFPTNLHTLQHKRHLFAEKPTALNLPDLQQLNTLAQQGKTKGQMSAVNYHRRYHTNFQKVYQVVQSGQIGQVEQINMVARDPKEPHQAYIQPSGGLFKDMSVHDIDMARYISGSEVQTVFCQGANLYSQLLKQEGDCDSGTISFQMKSGVLGTLHITRRAKSGYDQRLEVYGSEGTVRNDNNRCNDVEWWTQEGRQMDNGPYYFPEYYQQAFYKCMLNFIQDCFQGQQTHKSTFYEAYQNLKVGAAAQLSYQIGQKVDLDAFEKEMLSQ